MRDGEPRRFPRWLVSLAFLGFVVLVTEGVARLVFFAWFRFAAPPYAWCTADRSGEVYARLAFGYTDRDDLNLGRPDEDPLLGHQRAPDVFVRQGALALPPATSIVTLGDSFTAGAGVQPAESWPGWLASLVEGSRVVNLGTLAYGLDQALLRFEGYHDGQRVDVVALGFYGFMLRRSALTWNCFAKPRFDVREGRLVLPSTSIPTMTEVVAEVQRTAAVAWLLRLAATWVSPPAEAGENEQAALAQALLDRFVSDVRAVGAAPVVVFLPGESEVVEGSRVREMLQEWCTSKAVAFVDPTARVFPPGDPRLLHERVDEVFPPATGHYSARANRAVAEAVAEKIREIAGNRVTTTGTGGD